MKTLKPKLGLLVVLFLTSCASTVPLNQKFYNSRKVGVIIQVDSIGTARTGSQGLLDVALTQGNKYREPLHAIESKVNPTNSLTREISSILKSKNKQFIVITDEIIYKDLPKFTPPEYSDRKYFKKDLNAIKAKYKVDEVLYLNAKYGLLISYYGLIEIGRQGYLNISNAIVDLDDNSLLSQNTISSTANITGKWNDGPAYDNLKNSIQEAVDKSVNQLKTKF